MASIKDIKEEQKAERMEALTNVIETEIDAMWARLEMYALVSNVPIDEANNALPWLTQCHLAEMAISDDLSLEEFLEEAKRAYETVRDEDDGEYEEDDEDMSDVKLPDGLKVIPMPESFPEDKKEEETH